MLAPELRGVALAKPEKARPITSYEEYLRRYLPNEAEQASDEFEDPAEIGEEVGRRAVERAVANLTSSAQPNDES